MAGEKSAFAPSSGAPRGARAGSAAQDRLKVFVSYSRKDALEFADQLVAALSAYGYQPTIDRHGIAGAEKWQERLGTLILEADTVVFVLSPESATSDICNWEVIEADKRAKRLIPVVPQGLGAVQVPERLRNLNYIYFYRHRDFPDAGFGNGLARLVAALDTDLDWVRAHTRYQQRAQEWADGARGEARLLSGDDIRLAKEWAGKRPAKAPEFSPLQLEFIRASEEAAAAQTDTRRKELEAIAAAQAERALALEQAEAALKRAADAHRWRARIRNIAVVTVSVLALVAAMLGWHAATAAINEQKKLEREFSFVLWAYASHEVSALRYLSSKHKYMLGYYHFRQGNHAAAERLLKEAVEQRDFVAPSTYILAVMARLKNQLTNANQLLEVGIAYDPEYSSPYVERGMVHALLGQADAAINDISKAVSLSGVHCFTVNRNIIQPEHPLYLLRNHPRVATLKAMCEKSETEKLATETIQTEFETGGPR
jgi:tetratricopeptide (TPR) repeat protein